MDTPTTDSMIVERMTTSALAQREAKRRLTTDQRRYDRLRVERGLPLRNSLYIDRTRTPTAWTVYGMGRSGRIVLRAVDSHDEFTIKWQALARHCAAQRGERRRK